jgi:catechol 2,3-dioxygenase-like lactoylglutathione lyase family enzyme
MTRSHIALAVSDLDAAVDFYTALFGQNAHRRLLGYAQFLLDDPGLNLALTQTHGEKAHAGHFGIEVGAIDEVDRAMDRAQAAGLRVEAEADTRCCYSRQTKFWATDPDGRRWEFFYVAEREAGDPQGLSADPMPTAAPCCAGS